MRLLICDQIIWDKKSRVQPISIKTLVANWVRAYWWNMKSRFEFGQPIDFFVGSLDLESLPASPMLAQ